MCDPTWPPAFLPINKTKSHLPFMLYGKRNRPDHWSVWICGSFCSLSIWLTVTVQVWLEGRIMIRGNHAGLVASLSDWFVNQIRSPNTFVPMCMTAVRSPPGRSELYFHSQQILQIPSMALSHGCRKQTAWLHSASQKCLFILQTLCTTITGFHLLHVSCKQIMFTPHMAAASTIWPTRLCIALICWQGPLLC